jgi:hypothetical protein
VLLLPSFVLLLPSFVLLLPSFVLLLPSFTQNNIFLHAQLVDGEPALAISTP